MDPSEAFDKLAKDNPDLAKWREPANALPKSDAMVPDTAKTPTGQYLWENVKLAAAQNAEFINEGVRMYYRSTQAGYNPDMVEATIPSWLKRGTAMKNVDQEKLNRGSNTIAEGLAPAVRGVTSVAMLPVPGMGVAKNVALGMGMGEFGDLMKHVFTGTADWMGASQETQKTAGQVGEVFGASTMGFANVVRYNALAGATKQALGVPGDAARAAASAAKQKLAGDQRTAWELFTGRYDELRQAATSLSASQDKATRNLANIIIRDPLHQQKIEEMNKAMTNAVEPKGTAERTAAEEPFSLGQKTGNKTLMEMERTRTFKTPQEAQEALNRKEGQRKVVADAVQRATQKAGLPTNGRALADSVEAERQAALAKIDGLEKEASGTRKQVESWVPKDADREGEALRTQFTTEKQTAQAGFNKRYDGVYQQADETTGRYDLNPVLKDTGDVLAPMLSQVERGTAPESIRALNKLILRDKRAQAKATEAVDNVPFYMKRGAIPGQPGGFSFREIHDVIKELGKDAHAAARAENFPQMKNLNKVAESLQEQLVKQSTPEVAQEFEKINSDYRDKFVPRFREGVNYNLGREAGPSRTARDLIPGEAVWDNYLKTGDMVDRMEQFDELFGGKFAPRNAAAYNGLGKALEARFSDEVLKGGGFSRDRVNKFMKDYQPALDRAEGAKAKLEQTADHLDAIEQKQKDIAKQYEDIVKAPIANEVGPIQASQFFERAMADPLVMERALNGPLGNTPEKARAMLKESMVQIDPMTERGDLDASKLNKLLELGKKTPGGPSSFDLLVSKALGNGIGPNGELPPAAAAHKYRLEAISEIMAREQAVEHEQLRFENRGNVDPIKETTGTTTGGMWATLRNARMFGPNLFGAAVGRFVTNAMNRQMTAAMNKAMYDPVASENVLAMVRANKEHPINIKQFEGVMGVAKWSTDLLKSMIDEGFVIPQLARGAMYGGAQVYYPSDKQEADDSKPKRKLYP